LLFVLGFGWGVEGVALATVISEYAGLALAIWISARMLPRLGGRFSRELIASRVMLRRMLVFNRDVFIRTICLVFAFAYFTAQGAKMGDIMLAANAVLLNFQIFMAHGLDGLAHAAQALVGSAVGARDRESFRASVRISTLWAAIIALGFCVVFAVAGQAIIDLLTGIEEIREAAGEYLLWAIVSPAVSVWAYQLDGIFLGATRGRVMRGAMIVSLCVYVALCWTFVPLWGNHGLWFALIGFMAIRGVTLGLRYPALERSMGA
jgi:MATE family multidrug resistance protein